MNGVRPRPRRISLQALVAAGLLLLASGIFGLAVSADQHDYENASTAETEFPVVSADSSDHYPGEEATVGFQPTMEPFDARIDSDGVYADGVMIRSEWLDYSACHRFDNVSAFGIDRNGDGSDLEYDDDLTEFTKSIQYGEDYLWMEFFDFDDLGAKDPPFIHTDDRLVLQIGEESDEGPCITVTDDPGWYNVEFFLNGTEGDEDARDQASEDFLDGTHETGLIQTSQYVHVCECDDEEEARDQLGPPPEEPDPTPTPEQTPSPTPTETPTQTETPTPDETPTPTATNPDSRTPTPEPNDDEAEGERVDTPVQDDGTGFTPVVAFLALLSAVFLYGRQMNP